MNKTFAIIKLRRALVYLFVAVAFIILLCVLLVGLGDGNNIIKGRTDEKYNFSEDSIVFKEKRGEPRIKVYKTGEDKIVDMPLEEYVRGVVSAEMPAEFPIEALKAQAVAARTYVLARLEEYKGSKCSIGKGADICDSVHCQVYKSKEIKFSEWKESSALGYWNKISEAVAATSGQVLTYDGELVMYPYYFSTSSGRTENAAEVFSVDKPYLKSVKSENEEASKKYRTNNSFTFTELVNKINSKYDKAKVSSKNLKSQIKILSRTSGGGSVKEIKIGSVTISGKDFRFLLGLASSNFDITFNSKNVVIDCKGYGHGVGMSQWGASGMAKEGAKYTEILTHYYSGVKIEKYDAIK